VQTIAEASPPYNIILIGNAKSYFVGYSNYIIRYLVAERRSVIRDKVIDLLIHDSIYPNSSTAAIHEDEERTRREDE